LDTDLIKDRDCRLVIQQHLMKSRGCNNKRK
jgi:hypothetical protein